MNNGQQTYNEYSNFIQRSNDEGRTHTDKINPKISLIADNSTSRDLMLLKHFPKYHMLTMRVRYMIEILSRWPGVIIFALYKYTFMATILYLKS